MYNGFSMISLINHCTWLRLVKVNGKKSETQECIPVGCVPPTAVAIWGGVSTRHPPGPDPLPEQAPWSKGPQSRHPWDQAPPRAGTPLGPGSPRSRHPPGTSHPPVNRITETCKKEELCPIDRKQKLDQMKSCGGQHTIIL